MWSNPSPGPLILHWGLFNYLSVVLCLFILPSQWMCNICDLRNDLFNCCSIFVSTAHSQDESRACLLPWGWRRAPPGPFPSLHSPFEGAGAVGVVRRLSLCAGYLYPCLQSPGHPPAGHRSCQHSKTAVLDIGRPEGLVVFILWLACQGPRRVLPAFRASTSIHSRGLYRKRKEKWHSRMPTSPGPQRVL